MSIGSTTELLTKCDGGGDYWMLWYQLGEFFSASCLSTTTIVVDDLQYGLDTHQMQPLSFFFGLVSDRTWKDLLDSCVREQGLVDHDVLVSYPVS